MNSSKTFALHGIVPPLITPLLDHATLDHDGVDRLVEHLIAGGVHGLFVLGTTGEGPSLSPAVQRQMITRTVQQAARRVPVIVAVTHSSLSEAISLAEFAADNGAQAVVSSTPYYFDISQSELQNYITQLANSISLPLVLYNIPQRTRVKFEISTLSRLLEIENIIGMKDSSGDLEYLDQLLRISGNKDGFSILVGQEPILRIAYEMGAHGAVCGSANVFPAVFVKMYEAFRNGDEHRLEQFVAAGEEIFELFYGSYRYSVDGIAPLKYVLARQGICSETVVPPLNSFTTSQSQVFSEKYHSFGARERQFASMANGNY